MTDLKHPAVARGRHLPLSLSRRWMGDLMAAGITVPVMAAARTIRVAAAAMRRRVVGAPGWSTLILKAYALAAVERRELRWRTSMMPVSLRLHSCVRSRR